MLFAEKESNLIELFRILKTEEILLLPTVDETEYICQSLLNTRRWEKWIDSSAKDAPPPDFYNDNEQIMMDVMRVDDHGFKKHGEKQIVRRNVCFRFRKRKMCLSDKT